MSVETLSDLLRQSSPVAASRYRLKAGFRSLYEAGWLAEDGVVESILCDDCSTGHAANLVYRDNGYGYYCPELGFVSVRLDDVRAVSADTGRFVTSLADALYVSNRRSTPVHGKTWRIGKLQCEAGDMAIYYHPCLRSIEDVHDLKNALSREVRSGYRLVISATGRLHVEGATVAQLKDVVELDDSSGLRLMTSVWHLVGVLQKHTGGRPNIYQTKVEDLISARITSGEAFDSLNREAKAIQEALWDEKTKSGPSESTIKRYLRQIREGS